MAKFTPHPMSEEDKRLARSEDSFGRFLLAFAIAAVYGVVAFFTVWKLHETVPALLLHLLPGVRSERSGGAAAAAAGGLCRHAAHHLLRL